VDDDEDWPTPAPLGGSGVDGGILPGSTPDPTRSSVPAARRSAPERAAANAATAPASAAGKPSASARAAANATARKVAGGRPGATRAGGAGQGQGGAHGAGSAGGGRGAHKPGDDAWAGGADEPPWDPEFDPPVPGAAGHVGFDPGDEPADDDSVAGRSTEQAALDLLRDTLGAERIGGTDHS
jgi:DNA polymerase-3 subunit gamma/tau